MFQSSAHMTGDFVKAEIRRDSFLGYRMFVRPLSVLLLLHLVTTTHGFSSSRPPLFHQHQDVTRLAARFQRRPSNTAAFYSSTEDPPIPRDKVIAGKSFASRMRDLVLRENNAEKFNRLSTPDMPGRSKINPAKPPFVYEAVTLKQYKELVADEHDKLVVVRFYAKWCRACKAVEPLFYRMALSMPNVKFVEVPVQENNVNLHQGLGVPSLPYGHIYSPTAGLVEELRMVKGQFKTFHKIVETYREGQCTDLEMDPETGLFLSPFRLSDKAE